MERELTDSVVGGACRKPSHCFRDLLNVSSRGHKSTLPAVIRRLGGKKTAKSPKVKGQAEPQILIYRESFSMELKSYLDFHHQKRFGALLTTVCSSLSCDTRGYPCFMIRKPPAPYETIPKKFCENYPGSKISGRHSSSEKGIASISFFSR